MISLEHVSKTFQALDGSLVEAVRDISFTVEKGEFCSIVGPSGCGKTTLLELVAGLDTPTGGTVAHNFAANGNSRGWAGYMSQVDTLLPWRTVFDNATIGLELRGLPRRECQDRVLPLIQRVGLGSFTDKYPSELSGGMKKRLGLVRMLAYEPEVMLLDEPFAALDAQTREALQADLLELWRDFHRTVIFVTHDLLEAITLSDRILLLSRRPAMLKNSYRVVLPRPRSVEDIQFSDEFQSLYRDLRRALVEEVSDCRHETGSLAEWSPA
jgi:NitT/TauT family transport system ATP-binding protein